MARASTVTWLGIAMSVALGGAAASGAPPLVLLNLAGVLGQDAQLQSGTRQTQVHDALNRGIDCYRRGDYELAATLLQQAQASENDLTSEERKDLDNMLRLNNAALQARRNGAEQLHQAELALQAGRAPNAEAFLKMVNTNQFLSPADKLKAQQLADQMHQGSPSGEGAAINNEGSAPPAVLARTKLTQARLLMTKANYDAAEVLAREADKTGATFSPTEDSPRKVLDDIARLRSDAKGLLAASRTAYKRGDYDQAERLAHEAERAAGTFTFPLWSDSPTKVLKDIAAARAQAPVVKQSAVKPMEQPGSKSMPPTNGNAEAARQLVQQGYKALKAGDLNLAMQCATQAHALNVTFSVGDDTPDKLAWDIQRARANSPASVAKTETPSSPPADAHAQLRLARERFNAGQLDEADKLVNQAAAAPGMRWGLFEDSPEKLRADLRKARSRTEQEESVQVLVEARKLFEQGNYEQAKSKAYRAERLHGPYSIWDLGDRPQKLVAEIEEAEANNRRVKLPPPPGAPEPPAKGLENSTPEILPVVQATKPSNPWGGSAGKDDKAPTPVWPEPKQATPQVMQVGTPGSESPAAMPSPEMLKKEHARSMLAEARQMQKEGKLVEARQKALEAQKTGVAFGIDEDSPERALTQMVMLANKRIDVLLQEATDCAATAKGDPDHVKQAEEKLTKARQLAMGFTLDTQPIDAKSAWIHQVCDQSAAAGSGPAKDSLASAFGGKSADQPASAQAKDNWPAPPSLPPQETMPALVAPKDKAKSPVATSKMPGQELLEKARLELRRGETGTARRMAEEAYSGPYGVQAQADALLHSIDAEEFNQRILEANRSFEAGADAYRRKEYVQAGSILRSIDPHLLNADKQARLKELMQMPDLHPKAPMTQVAAKPAATVAPSLAPSVESSMTTSTDTTKVKLVSPEQSYAQQVQAMQEVQFQKMRDEGLKAQREATERFQAGETDRALDLLQDYLAKLREAQLEPDKVMLLRRPVESRLQLFKTLKARQDFETVQVNQHHSFEELKSKEAKMEQHKQEQVAELMKQYHTFYKEGKYNDAAMVASRAHDLDPDNAMAAAAVAMAETQRNVTEYADIKKRKEAMVLGALDQSEDPGPYVDSNNPLSIDKEVWKRAQLRKGISLQGLDFTVKSQKEREIEQRLNLPISFDFKDTPLKQVIDDLRDWTGINIVADQPALDDENISLDRPVTMKLEGVSLKSALDLVLHQAHLTYVIKAEVLQITTESHSRGKQVSKTYQVADLIIPVENHSVATAASVVETMFHAPSGTGLQSLGPVPSTPQHGLPNGASVGSSGGNTFATSMAANQPTAGSAPRAPGQTMEDLLIKLITNTIAPQSWSDMGGPGTIDYYPLGMALVINQTPDIQEQVAELLAALRRLQDLEVAVEIRFITLSEAFFERIGLNFNVQFETSNTKYEGQLVTQQFQPIGFINEFDPKRFLAGLTPGGTLTNNLDIPLTSTSFGPAIPPFGGFPTNTGADGGLSLGLAFLSDIQVYMFMEAAQGDRRTNVMQAPKLTLFNGQTSTINVNDFQFFVTNIVIAQFNGQVVFVPQNQAAQFGLNLAIQAVVSADRRFVRMNLAPTLTNLAAPVTALFPVTTFITPIFEGGAQGQPVPFTQFVQQPNLTTVGVLTTVSVPDGGTVLLGGLKTLREGRNEFGPPILSKLPYINRLFKNVGYGRESESLLLMVTPRVIINEEEEGRQTGVGPGGVSATGGP